MLRPDKCKNHPLPSPFDLVAMQHSKGALRSGLKQKGQYLVFPILILITEKLYHLMTIQCHHETL